MTALSVVVVTYSPGETLESFLTSLDKATTRPVQVVLADNGSTDGSPERAAATREHVRLLSTGGNLGFGRAANLGVAATDTDWVVIANPDLTWAPGSLDALLDAADRWPRAGSLGPLIRDETGQVYPSARELPALGRGVGHALCGWWWPNNPWTLAYRRARGGITERPAGWLSGSCLLLRRAAFDSVRGFDPGYFMYFEDLDLGDRLGKAGWLNVYVPTAEVTHLGGHSTSRDQSRMLAAHHHSAYRYLSRHYRGPVYAPLRAVLRVGLAARSIVVRRIPFQHPITSQAAPPPPPPPTDEDGSTA